MDAVSEANGTFALRLFKMLCEDNPSHNGHFSPASLSWALAWSSRGQKGTPLPRLPRSTASLWPGDRLPEFSEALSLSAEKDIHVGFHALLAEECSLVTHFCLQRPFRSPVFSSITLSWSSFPLSKLQKGQESYQHLVSKMTE
ncbi:hypothetical protein QTO34_018202, partial [Cnephaeus nilssonii]